jgi:hypothetical protein
MIDPLSIRRLPIAPKKKYTLPSLGLRLGNFLAAQKPHSFKWVCPCPVARRRVARLFIPAGVWFPFSRVLVAARGLP